MKESLEDKEGILATSTKKIVLTIKPQYQALTTTRRCQWWVMYKTEWLFFDSGMHCKFILLPTTCSLATVFVGHVHYGTRSHFGLFDVPNGPNKWINESEHDERKTE